MLHTSLDAGRKICEERRDESKGGNELFQYPCMIGIAYGLRNVGKNRKMVAALMTVIVKLTFRSM